MISFMQIIRNAENEVMVSVCIRSNCKLGHGDSKMMKATPQRTIQRVRAEGDPRKTTGID